jgi:hypothetical protein
VLLEALDRRTPRERNRAPPEAAPRHARAEDAVGVARRFDQRVQFGTADLVVVAQAGVRGKDVVSERAEVAGVEMLLGVEHARVFAHDVAGAPVERFRQRRAVRLEHVGRGVAQCLDVFVGVLAERGGGALALLAALVVLRGRQLAAHARVGDHQRRLAFVELERHVFVRQRAAVQKEGVPGPPEARGELVHNPALDAGVLVLDLLAELGHLDGSERSAGGHVGEEHVQRHGGGHLQCRRRAEASSQRHVAVDDRLEAAAEALAPAQRVGHASGVGGPPLVRRPLRQPVADLFVERRGVEAHPLVGTPAHGHVRRAVDGRRQDEAAGVVGVPADQIDAPRRTCHDGRSRGPRGGPEALADLLAELVAAGGVVASGYAARGIRWIGKSVEIGVHAMRVRVER